MTFEDFQLVVYCLICAAGIQALVALGLSIWIWKLSNFIKSDSLIRPDYNGSQSTFVSRWGTGLEDDEFTLTRPDEFLNIPNMPLKVLDTFTKKQVATLIPSVSCPRIDWGIKELTGFCFTIERQNEEYKLNLSFVGTNAYVLFPLTIGWLKLKNKAWKKCFAPTYSINVLIPNFGQDADYLVSMCSEHILQVAENYLNGVIPDIAEDADEKAVEKEPYIPVFYQPHNLSIPTMCPFVFVSGKQIATLLPKTPYSVWTAKELPGVEFFVSSDFKFFGNTPLDGSTRNSYRYELLVSENGKKDVLSGMCYDENDGWKNDYNNHLNKFNFITEHIVKETLAFLNGEREIVDPPGSHFENYPLAIPTMSLYVYGNKDVIATLVPKSSVEWGIKELPGFYFTMPTEGQGHRLDLITPTDVIKGVGSLTFGSRTRHMWNTELNNGVFEEENDDENDLLYEVANHILQAAEDEFNHEVRPNPHWVHGKKNNVEKVLSEIKGKLLEAQNYLNGDYDDNDDDDDDDDGVEKSYLVVRDISLNVYDLEGKNIIGTLRDLTCGASKAWCLTDKFSKFCFAFVENNSNKYILTLSRRKEYEMEFVDTEVVGQIHKEGEFWVSEPNYSKIDLGVLSLTAAHILQEAEDYLNR